MWWLSSLVPLRNTSLSQNGQKPRYALSKPAAANALDMFCANRFDCDVMVAAGKWLRTTQSSPIYQTSRSRPTPPHLRYRTLTLPASYLPLCCLSLTRRSLSFVVAYSPRSRPYCHKRQPASSCYHLGAYGMLLIPIAVKLNGQCAVRCESKNAKMGNGMCMHTTTVVGSH